MKLLFRAHLADLPTRRSSSSSFRAPLKQGTKATVNCKERFDPADMREVSSRLKLLDPVADPLIAGNIPI